MFGTFLNRMGNEVKEVKNSASFHLATALPNALGLTQAWNSIAKNLILGRIPLKGDKEDLFEIDFIKSYCVSQGDPLGLVVSVVEEYEITKKRKGMNPILPKNWLESGVDHFRLTMEDGNPKVSISDVIELVFKIQQYRASKTVLIHCKAGKTRSAMVVCCVLAMFDFYDTTKSSEALVSETISYIAKSRREINISSDFEERAVEIVQAMREMIDENYSHKSSLSLVSYNGC